MGLGPHSGTGVKAFALLGQHNNSCLYLQTSALGFLSSQDLGDNAFALPGQPNNSCSCLQTSALRFLSSQDLATLDVRLETSNLA
jgi:hypothetical protein